MSCVSYIIAPCRELKDTPALLCWYRVRLKKAAVFNCGLNVKLHDRKSIMAVQYELSSLNTATEPWDRNHTIFFIYPPIKLFLVSVSSHLKNCFPWSLLDSKCILTCLSRVIAEHFTTRNEMSNWDNIGDVVLEHILKMVPGVQAERSSIRSWQAPAVIISVIDSN